MRVVSPTAMRGQVSPSSGTTSIELRGTAIDFPRASKRSTAADRNERARALLELLRSEDDGLTFGGRLKHGIDGGESLSRYYRVLELARAILLLFPDAADSVTTFLENVSVPEDLRELLEEVVYHDLGVAQTVSVAKGILGNVATWDRPESSNDFWAAWQQGNPDTVRVNDSTVRHVFTDWGWGRDFNGYFPHGSPEIKAGIFRFWARAKELGQENLVANQAQVQGYVGQVPATAEGAGSVLRFCSAFGFEANEWLLGGKPLKTWAKDPAVRRWFRGASRSSVTSVRPTKSRRGGKPLGDIRTWENDPNHNAMWQRMSAGDPSVGSISDITVRKFFETWNLSHDLGDYHSSSSPDARALWIKIWARARELNIANAQISWGKKFAGFVRSLPASRETALALVRLGSAFEMDVGAYQLGTLPVAEWVRGSGGIRAKKSSRAPVVPARLPGRPLGNVATWENEQSSNNLWGAWQTGSDQIGLVTDETVRKWFGQWGIGGQDLAVYMAYGTVESKIGGVLIWARGRELGLSTPVDVTQLAVQIAGALPPTQAAADALRRLGRAIQYDVEALALGNQRPVSAFPKRGLGRGSGSQVAALTLPIAGPLGDRRFTKKEIEDRIEAKDASLFALDDSSLKRLSECGTVQKLAATSDAHEWMLGALRAANRMVELDLGQPADVGLMLRSIPIAAFSDERIAEAAVETAQRTGVNPSSQQLSDGSTMGTHATVSPWVSRMDRILAGSGANLEPRRLDPGDADVRAQALTDDLAMLSPDSGAHAADREGTALRLLSVTEAGTEIAHELSELLPPILWALADDRLTRVNLKDAPSGHRHELLADSFERWEHPGAIAVMSGLLFDVRSNDLERLLIQKGQLKDEARRLSQISGQLAELEIADLRFVLSDVRPLDPDFTTLPLRLAMCQEELSPKALREQFDKIDAETFARVVLERVVSLSPDSQSGSQLMQFLKNRVLDEELDEGVLRDLVDPALARRIERAASKTIAGAMAGYTRGDDALRIKARDSIAEAIRLAGMLIDPDVLVRSTLEQIYKFDLQHVAPLAEADVALGGVQGKVWEVRGRDPAEEQDVVDVAGVPLKARPVAESADRAESPNDIRLETETGRRNLRMLATRWLSSERIELVGDGRFDLESAPQQVAHMIRAPYRHVHISSETQEMSDVAKAELRSRLEEAAVVGAVLHLTCDTPWPTNLGRTLEGLDDSRGLRIVARSLPDSSRLEGFARTPMRALSPQDFEEIVARSCGEGFQFAEEIARVHADIVGLWRRGEFGKSAPPFGLATLAKIIRRVDRFSSGDLSDAALVRRELEEIYARGLPDEHRQLAVTTIAGSLPEEVSPFYRRLALEVARDGVANLGDVTILSRAETSSPGRPEVVDVPRRFVEAFYLLVKAFECGESATIVGSEGPQMAAWYAHLSGQALREHLLSRSTELSEILPEGARGMVLLVHDLEEAREDVVQGLLTAARRGEIQLIRSIPNGPGSTTSTLSASSSGADWTVVRCPELETFEERVEAASEWANRQDVPPAVASAVVTLVDEMVDDRGNDIGGGDEVGGIESNAAQRWNSIIETIALIGTLSKTMNLGEAYLTAVEAVLGTEDSDATETLLERARALAEA